MRGEAWALVFALLFPVAAAWVYFVAAGESGWLAWIYSACKAVQFAFPVAWIAWAGGWSAGATAPGGETPGHLPVPHRRRPLAGLGPGIASGLVMTAGLAGLYAGALRGGDLMAGMAPRIAARVDTIGAGTPVRYLLLALFLSVLHSWLEEYYWRWFVFGRLSRRLGVAAAIVVSSLAFAAHHVVVLATFLGPDRYGTTALFSLGVAAAGALWAGLYRRSHGLLSPWLSHLCVDMAIMAIGYDLVWG